MLCRAHREGSLNEAFQFREALPSFCVFNLWCRARITPTCRITTSRKIHCLVLRGHDHCVCFGSGLEHGRHIKQWRQSKHQPLSEFNKTWARLLDHKFCLFGLQLLQQRFAQFCLLSIFCHSSDSSCLHCCWPPALGPALEDSLLCIDSPAFDEPLLCCLVT